MDKLQDIEENRIMKIKFADDTGSIADTEEKLHKLVDGLNETCKH